MMRDTGPPSSLFGCADLYSTDVGDLAMLTTVTKLCKDASILLLCQSPRTASVCCFARSRLEAETGL